jgi:hypothetical protein
LLVDREMAQVRHSWRSNEAARSMTDLLDVAAFGRGLREDG